MLQNSNRLQLAEDKLQCLLCEADGNTETLPDFREMQSQGKSWLITDLLAVQHRLRKGAVAQISLVHQATSESLDAADATGKVNMKSESPRVCCLDFAGSCRYAETSLLICFCPSV